MLRRPAGLVDVESMKEEMESLRLEANKITTIIEADKMDSKIDDFNSRWIAKGGSKGSCLNKVFYRDCLN